MKKNYSYILGETLRRMSGTMSSCRYCLDDNIQFTMIRPCHCSGTSSNVHVHCLVRWLWTSRTFHCPVCKMDFKNRETWYVITQLSTVCNLLLEFTASIYEIVFVKL